MLIQAHLSCLTPLAPPPSLPLKESVAKEELIEFEGVVTEVLPDTRYVVTLENNIQIIAYVAGKMKMHRIKIIQGDRVTVQMSPYDLTKGRIHFRHKDANAAPRSPQQKTYKRR